MPSGNPPAEYTVVLRARSAARFLPEEGWQITLDVPSLELTGVRVRAFTRWVLERGKELPRELVIEVRGQAGSLDEATAKFPVIARPLATLVAFVANVLVGPLEVHLAYDSTPTSEEREFLETFLPDERGSVSEGRIIRRHLLEAAGLAFVTLATDAPRINRALRHYELALRHWYVGGEWLALNHLWIAAENLTKVVIRKIVAARDMTEAELAHEYELATDDPNRPRWKDLLGARVREAVIFQGDTDTYKTAKDASNGLEHGIWELDRVASHALRAADKTFHYIRHSIADLLGVPPEVVDELLEIPPKDVQSLRRVARGHLLGPAEDPAMEGELYPRLDWSTGIESVVREGATFQLRQTERMTIRTHPQVGFRLERFEVHGRLQDGQAPLEMSNRDVIVDHTPAAPSAGLLEAVMPLVDAAAATGAEQGHTPASFAFNMFGQAVAFYQSVEALVVASLPVEALAPLRGLTTIAARFQQMVDRHGHGLGVAVRAVLDSISTSGADPEVVEASAAKVSAAAVAARVEVPSELPPAESSTIFQRLAMEMELALPVVQGSYGSVVLHSSKIDGERAGFRTTLEQGPLTDLVVSAAVIAMLDVLVNAVALFDWTADAAAIGRIVAKAQEVNDGAGRLVVSASPDATLTE